ncbi:DUF3570 domain-containing protein [Flavobacteriaceae bacterium]|nr:DUF3570 domain-containing protein [Flavobacteriaceae bacterium]
MKQQLAGMAEKLEAAAAVINMRKIRITLSVLWAFVGLIAWGQQSTTQPTPTYQKKVLEGIEIETLFSYYAQEGTHGAVGGGLGTEQLTDVTPTVVVNVPLNFNTVLTVETGLSAYSSASSSNINPFYSTLGGNNDGDKYDDDYDDKPSGTGRGWGSGTGAISAASTGVVNGVSTPIGTPWYASSGASRSDVLGYISAAVAQSSEDRNQIVSANLYVSTEYDYTSLGVGLGLVKLFNEKNTELGIKGKAYFDKWMPIYPTELHEYGKYGNNFLNSGYFSGVPVWDINGIGTSGYKPSAFTEWSNANRNSYTMTLEFSQILSAKTQFSMSVDVVGQQGLLSTPYHRIYFADKPQYFIGDHTYINNYEQTSNYGVFRLADDVERLPNSRLKIPVGGRFHWYLNDLVTLRTFYRYYFDNWGVDSQTASVELPLKLSSNWVFTPSFRWYEQSQADYFAPYGVHLSTERYYTSDYDLSGFTSKQIGFGLGYKDIFGQVDVLGFGLKTVDFRFQHYYRSDGLEAVIYGFGIKFVEK